MKKTSSATSTDILKTPQNGHRWGLARHIAAAAFLFTSLNSVAATFNSNAIVVPPSITPESITESGGARVCWGAVYKVPQQRVEGHLLPAGRIEVEDMTLAPEDCYNHSPVGASKNNQFTNKLKSAAKRKKPLKGSGWRETG